MRKVFISFLGSNRYRRCVYTRPNGFKSTVTRFIQTAIFEMLQYEKITIDEFYLFVTPEAKQNNFEGNNEKFNYEGLNNVWKQTFPDIPLEPKLVDIASRQTEQNQWDLFEQIFQVIQPGDEIYLDMTHSFRSIPVMSLLIANFAKTIKNATINRLFYGNFESIRELGDINELDPEERLAPIDDLTSILNLLDWTTSVKTFIDTGNPEQIHQLATEQLKANHQNKNLITIKRLTNSLNNLNKNMETSRGISIYDTINHVRENIQSVKQIPESELPQLSKLMDEIDNKVELFTDDRKKNMWGSVKWCADHGLYQQAYTLVREYVISILYDELQARKLLPNGDISVETERNIRDDISSIIYCYFNPKKVFSKGKYEKSHLFVKPIEEIIGSKEEAYKNYNLIMNYRNNMNHAEKAQHDRLSYERIKDKIYLILEAVKPIFFK